MPEKATGKDRLKEITDSIKTGIGTIDPVFLRGLNDAVHHCAALRASGRADKQKILPTYCKGLA